MATIKRKQTEGALGKDTTPSKRRRRSHGKASELPENTEHAELLSSVTGQIQRLPLYEESREEEEETEGRDNVGGDDVENTGENTEEITGVDKLTAAEYLMLWDSDRDKWSFKKKTQFWLLKNMYDKKKLSKSNFKLMLCYMDGLRGNQRGLAKERAEKMVVQTESDRDQIPESNIMYKRARKVVKVLSG